MGFKIVRTDAVESYKIPLPVGKYPMGRGKFLKCEDKKVSRNHGELEVTETYIRLKSLHQNPCFYLKKDADDMVILSQNCEVQLTNGDKFGLLPLDFWFQVIHIGDQEADMDPTVDEQNTETNSAIDSNQTVYNNSQDEIKLEINEDDTHGEQSQSPSLVQPESPSLIQPVSPSLCRESEQLTADYNITVPNAVRLAPEGDDESTDDVPQSSNDKNNLSIKRSLSPEASPIDNKKIKPDPGSPTDNGNSQNENQAGPSKQDGAGGAIADANQAAPLPAKPRERCYYGANCYRRNPQHKAQYSHPADADWGVGERGVCPHGAACRARGPRHWLTHHHPPGTRPPADRPPGKKPNRKPKKKRDRGSSSESDSEDPAALILNTKRIRKTVKRQSWSGSESENEYDMDDPFMTDGSADDWQPSDGSFSGTQGTQD